MNTPTLITLVIFFGVMLWLLFFTIKQRSRNNDKDERRILLFFILIIIVIIGGTVIAGLNVYGIGRLPLLNSVTNKIPQDYSPPENTVNPPVNGPTQPPSQPFFEDHKKLMEKLKRDGL